MTPAGARGLSAIRPLALAALLAGALAGEASGQVPAAVPEKRLPAGRAHAVPARTVSPAPENPVYHVVSYRLDLTAAMVDENFGGRNLITLVLKAPADSLVFNQLWLQIDSVVVNGTPCAFALSDPSEQFTVQLGSTLPAGDTLRCAVWYRRLPGVARESDRLGYYYFQDTLPGLPANLGYTMSEPSDARCWMPCYDQPWEKSTSEMFVTVPQGYVAASNGILEGVTDAGGGNATWHWVEAHQIATYLMCSTISKFTNPASRLAVAPGDTIPVEYFVWQRDSLAAAAFLPVVRLMITNLGKLYGPYPWDKYGMTAIVPFAYGGMEHQTITTLNEYVATDTDVVVHELSHQWWGDLVTCGTWKDIWLNESFATYSEALFHETLGGRAALRNELAGMLNLDVLSWTDAVYDPEGQGIYLFSDVVYSKGAWVLHTLRGVMGDSAFFRTLRLWRQLYGQKSAVTADFASTAGMASGSDMSWFFNEWIYGPGYPVYSLAFDWEGGALGVRIAQQQDPTWPTYRMPLPVRVYYPGRDSTFTVWDTARVQDFRIPLAAPPDSVALDPDRNLLWKQGSPIGPPVPAGTLLSFSLGQNYPNPFNGTTEIPYVVPGAFSTSSAPAAVSLVVYDVLGRRVATLVDAPQAPGEYFARFDGTGLASGVYFYRLETATPGGTTSKGVGKMVLVR
ncbi:MAG TPA: M1 family aminopeptidase [Bacteroidota bacterium]|nr:M1 family aminopeptidase [Bacteroidota bacterium]